MAALFGIITTPGSTQILTPGTAHGFSSEPPTTGQAPTLLILAAGVGTRFGGIKQLEPVGPRGAAILDHTIFDAFRAGFRRVLLVVRPETEDLVRDHLHGMDRRWREVPGFGLESIGLVIQPGIPEGPRWGTAYAVLAAASEVAGPFAVANADDFYGRESLDLLAAHLSDPDRGVDWAMVAFPLSETLSPHGGVSRGICVQGPDGSLESLRETTGIARDDDGVIRDGSGAAIPEKTPVSMNLWGFDSGVFDLLSELAGERARGRGDSAGSGEFRLPDAVARAIRGGTRRVRVLRTTGRWIGLTHPGDLEEARWVIGELHRDGLYP